jgi:hypothetical protein
MADPERPRREQTLAGWAYRQVLEIVVSPPPDVTRGTSGTLESLSLLPSLACQAGLQDKTLSFVIKNDLDKVVPPVKAIGTAA